jgi:hypothetical protein
VTSRDGFEDEAILRVAQLCTGLSRADSMDEDFRRAVTMGALAALAVVVGDAAANPRLTDLQEAGAALVQARAAMLGVPFESR